VNFSEWVGARGDSPSKHGTENSQLIFRRSRFTANTVVVICGCFNVF